MGFKVKKQRKSKRQRGQTTYGHGARKKWKGSGHRGGKGMAGSGKRADQKKTLVNKLYGNDYFGKKGVTSRKTEKDRNKVMNLGAIEKNYDHLMKKHGENGTLELKDYKILGEGEIRKVKLVVREISETALEKIKKAGGDVEVIKKKVEKITAAPKEKAAAKPEKVVAERKTVPEAKKPKEEK
ncbi:uL15 family ribosomal protein [Candidatus Pacearchaeota archaeon]|nr:uL15 family ribosomal protein [Candidatus Pacearchaeota archaeon]